MSGPTRADIVVIGDEVLRGECLDQNAPYLCRVLTEAGIDVRSVRIVRDQVRDIACAISELIERDPTSWILTTGGLGPTPDDVTYLGVAEALGRPLRSHPGMMEFVRAWSDGLRETSREFRCMARMAQAPENAYLLTGAKGSAPALVVDVGRQPAQPTIVMLPGVPDFVVHLMESCVLPFMRPKAEGSVRTAVIEHSLEEALLESVFDIVAECHDGVSLGSYVGPPRRLVLHGDEQAVGTAMRDVQAAMERLVARAPDAWTAAGTTSGDGR